MLYSLISLDCISSLSWTLIVLYYILLYMKYFYLFLLKHIFLSCLLAYKHLEMKNYCSSLLGRRHRHPTPVLLPGKPLDEGAWKAAVHGVAEGQTRLSDFTFTFHFPALEKEMAVHSSVLAWRIPGTGEPGGLPSVGSHRVGHDWSKLAAAAAGMLS